MKRRLIHGFFTAYILFALMASYTSLVPPQESFAVGADPQTIMESSPQVVQHYRRLDVADTQDTRTRTDDTDQKQHYTIRVWAADWCGSCKRYKKEELPALLKFGYQVEVLDFDEDNPPETVKSIPTVMLYYKGDLVEIRSYWRAISVDRFVEGRLALKKAD